MKVRFFLLSPVILAALLVPAHNAWCVPTDTCPAYEPANGDFRFCQTFKTALDWGANCFVATGLIGSYQYRNDLWKYHTTFWDLEPVSYAAVGMWLTGGALGAFVGYGDGEYCTQQRREHPGFHLTKNNLGHRILLIFHDYPRYHLVYQRPNENLLWPDVFRLGFVFRGWSGTPNYSFWARPGQQYDRSFFGRELKWEAGAAWDLLRYRNVTVYGGLGSGPAWAQDYVVATQAATKITTGFIRLLGGVRLNVQDYFFLETEADYEPWGVYQKLRELHPYHPTNVVTFHIYLGMYVIKV
jgi:hypothetical protein